MICPSSQASVYNLRTISSFAKHILKLYVFPLYKYTESKLGLGSVTLSHEEILSVADERLTATFKLPENLKLYHNSVCWMSPQAIHHTPVIEPENRL